MRNNQMKKYMNEKITNMLLELILANMLSGE